MITLCARDLLAAAHRRAQRYLDDISRGYAFLAGHNPLWAERAAGQLEVITVFDAGFFAKAAGRRSVMFEWSDFGDMGLRLPECCDHANRERVGMVHDETNSAPTGYRYGSDEIQWSRCSAHAVLWRCLECCYEMEGDWTTCDCREEP